MAKNLAADGLEIDPVNSNNIRSRLMELSAAVDVTRSFSIPEQNIFLRDFSRNLSVLTEQPDVEDLSSVDLESYIENLKKELLSTEEENMKLTEEIQTIEAGVVADSARLDGELEAFSTLFNLIDSKGIFSTNSLTIESSFFGGALESQGHDSLKYKFKVLELRQQIEKAKSKFTTLEDLKHDLRRLETICSFEDLFCGVKCIQYEDNFIKLSLRTPIPSLKSATFKRNLDFSMESAGLDHELLIELTEEMELKNIEVFPCDVHLDGVVNTLNSSRFLSITAAENTFGWLLRQVQQRITLSTLRRILVKVANNSRFNVIYSDPDEMITAHVAGLVASIKISQGWPLSNYPLMLWSLKHSDRNFKTISWSLLCKIQEQANSLDVDTRMDLQLFLDSIEKLVTEVQTGNQENTTPS